MKKILMLFVVSILVFLLVGFKGSTKNTDAKDVSFNSKQVAPKVYEEKNKLDDNKTRYEFIQKLMKAEQSAKKNSVWFTDMLLLISKDDNLENNKLLNEAIDKGKIVLQIDVLDKNISDISHVTIHSAPDRYALFYFKKDKTMFQSGFSYANHSTDDLDDIDFEKKNYSLYVDVYNEYIKLEKQLSK